MFVTILTMVLVAVSPVNPVTSAPALLGGGGPDAYGYKYLDSDTTAPGAPTYNWISIKGVGTEITTLGDDNVAGPFNLGFTFPYYWYQVTSCYVGSNGYIAFHDNAMNASPFNPVPGTQRSNNTLAPLLSDLECSAAGSPDGSVWYWTNTAADTFIVEYDSIRFWSTGGNNTFQIIVSKPDSSITFQYKEQSGSPYNGWAPTSNQTGIENVSGAVGLNYLSGTVPPGNMYHTDLAVRFFPPESTSYQVHDVGIKNAMNDRNGGVFCVNTRPLALWANVKNFGNQSEGQYMTYFKVTRTNGATLFSDSVNAPASTPGQIDSLSPANWWWPAQTGVFIIKIFTKMTGDMMRANDTVTIECRVLPNPLDGANLAYDGGTPGNYMMWNGPGGFGNRFVPPVYPCSISSYKINMQSSGSTPCWLALLDDDGPDGAPGSVLDSHTVTVTAANWYSVTAAPPVVCSSGAFYVGGVSTVSNEPSFGMDSIPPLSFQGWENTGVWAPSRDASARDICANATISGTVGILEELQPAPAPVLARLDVNPNPFGNQTSIRLLNPRGNETAIELYDATGSVVRVLTLERGVARLDGKLLSDGIYFARVAGAEAPVAKVIVTH